MPEKLSELSPADLLTNQAVKDSDRRGSPIHDGGHRGRDTGSDDTSRSRL
jgi:hypothetical protein